MSGSRIGQCMPCPVSIYVSLRHEVLQVRFSGTEGCYAGTRRVGPVREPPTRARSAVRQEVSPYAFAPRSAAYNAAAVFCTGGCYVAVKRCTVPGTEAGYAATRSYDDVTGQSNVLSLTSAQVRAQIKHQNLRSWYKLYGDCERVVLC
eukprot:3754069-Rhodomonas_salina.2